jgi:hypothetical protein
MDWTGKVNWLTLPGNLNFDHQGSTWPPAERVVAIAGTVTGRLSGFSWPLSNVAAGAVHPSRQSLHQVTSGLLVARKIEIGHQTVCALPHWDRSPVSRGGQLVSL